MSDVIALILAAGQSTRMGSNKLLAKFNSKPLVMHVAEAAIASNANGVFVVTGHENQLLEAALIGLPVAFIHNEHYADGMAASLKTGISAMPSHIDGVLVLLGDMPLISFRTLNTLVDAFKKSPKHLAVVPSFNGEWGNPVLIARGLFGEISLLTGDKGARQLLEGLGDRVLELPLKDESIFADVDTASALSNLVFKFIEIF